MSESIDTQPDHEFVGVVAHPDDDECTHRADGTDETYCGRTRAEHEPESIDTQGDRSIVGYWVAADDEPLFLVRDPSIAVAIAEDHNALLDENRDLRAERDSLRAENERLRLDQSLDAGEIVDVLTDAGIAPADYGGSIKSAIEALVGMDRITTANLAAAEAKLAAVAQLCDEASMEICHLDGMDSHMAVAVDDIRAALGLTGEDEPQRPERVSRGQSEVRGSARSGGLYGDLAASRAPDPSSRGSRFRSFGAKQAASRGR